MNNQYRHSSSSSTSSTISSLKKTISESRSTDKLSIEDLDVLFSSIYETVGPSIVKEVREVDKELLRGYLLSDPYNTVGLTWKDRFEQLSVKNHDTDSESAYLKDLVDTPEKGHTESAMGIKIKPAKTTKKSGKYGTKK